MNEQGNYSNGPTPPEGWSNPNAGHTTPQPVVTQAAPQASAAPAKKGSSLKTFLLAFAGAAVACIICLGVYNAVHPSSTVIGGNGDGTSITVNGEDTTLAEVVSQKCLPSVVNIDVYTRSQSSSYYGYMYGQSNSTELTESSLGSGIILSADGYILTNYHVIEDADQLKVNAAGDEYVAQVVGTDASSDLAVIKIDASGLTPVEIGSSSDLVVGEWVMAVGSPFGLEQSVSTGIVSATSRTTSALNTSDSSSSSSSSAVYTNMIQTDAAINPGNSGGALVDKDGKLIGVNTLIASSSGSSSGVGFAIPVDYAMNIAQQIIDGKTPSHAALGVSGTTVTSQIAKRYNLSTESGAYITSVTTGSAAANAGLKEGDIVTKVDSSDITSSTDLVLAVRSHNVGDTVQVTYNRDGNESTVSVTLGSDS
jgi:S1-C subfamily serine protease